MKKRCAKCGAIKEKTDFYKSNCKDCHSKRVQSDKKRKAEREVEELMKLNIIKSEEFSSAVTLYESTKSRIEACKYNTGIYKDISCEYDSPISFMKNIIMDLPQFWRDWKIQYKIFEATKQSGDRPTIDRIDDFGNYTRSNIQMLSKTDNSKKAAVRPCKVLIIKNHYVDSVVEFDSKSEMNKKLVEKNIPVKTVKIQMNEGKIQEIGNGYSLIVQSKKSKIIPSGKALYKVVINQRREVCDLDTGEVVEVLGTWDKQFEVNAIRI